MTPRIVGARWFQLFTSVSCTWLLKLYRRISHSVWYAGFAIPLPLPSTHRNYSKCYTWGEARCCAVNCTKWTEKDLVASYI